ncbi:hypothetical protein Ancab_037305 [Ancistrocladus abbreviatus]
MAPRRSVDSSLWLSKPPSSNIHTSMGSTPFRLDSRLLAKRSAKVATLLNEKPNEDPCNLLQDIPADPETLELLARFCHGFDVNMSSENIIPLICLAEHLVMTESHSTNNLLKKARVFFEQRILPSWNECIKSLLSADHVFQQAMQLHLLDACVESLTRKALAHPNLLGDPTRDLKIDADGKEDSYAHGCRMNARRRLFVCNWKSEELSSLPVHLYEPIIQRMIQHGMPPEYVTGSLLQYINRWICSDGMERSSQREVVEAVERLLPSHKNLLSCTLLFEMLSIAITLDASFLCKNGFEIRIGKQLDQASVKDLFIPTSLCYKQVEYDIESVRRIMQSFYKNFTGADASGLVKVAKLMEDFLAEAASDGDLKTGDFIALADLSVSASTGTNRYSDGIYRAVNIYLDKHRCLTESEREDVCQVLDFNKMSPEARQHAAQSQILPLRAVVQSLFISQLQLQDVITTQTLQHSGESVKMTRVEEGGRKLVRDEEDNTEFGGDKLDKKLLEFEERAEMEENCYCHKLKKEKVSLWREMKRKFGCITSMHDCDCQMKKKNKVYPK